MARTVAHCSIRCVDVRLVHVFVRVLTIFQMQRGKVGCKVHMEILRHWTDVLFVKLRQGHRLVGFAPRNNASLPSRNQER